MPVWERLCITYQYGKDPKLDTVSTTLSGVFRIQAADRPISRHAMRCHGLQVRPSDATNLAQARIDLGNFPVRVHKQPLPHCNVGFCLFYLFVQPFLKLYQFFLPTSSSYSVDMSRYAGSA